MSREQKPRGRPFAHRGSLAAALSPIAVIARLARLRRIADAELEATFAEHGLNGADFGALVTLRRIDQPGGISQRQLMRELNLSSGTVSVRVERLSDRGLVTRTTDPTDRRNTLITLTDAGRTLFEEVTPAHIATENRLLAALTSDQRDQLTELLRILLLSHEGSTSTGTFPHLGLTLAPAHLTLEIRRSVGLPDIVGLLVRGVEPGSRADAAGIKTGDVLVRAAYRELRSISTLYAAARDAQETQTLTIKAIRSANTKITAQLDLHPRPTDQPAPGRTSTPPSTTTHTL